MNRCECIRRVYELGFALDDLVKKGDGKIDVSALPKGSYTFTLTVTFSDSTTATPRELEFNK